MLLFTAHVNKSLFNSQERLDFSWNKSSQGVYRNKIAFSLLLQLHIILHALFSDNGITKPDKNYLDAWTCLFSHGQYDRKLVRTKLNSIADMIEMASFDNTKSKKMSIPRCTQYTISEIIFLSNLAKPVFLAKKDPTTYMQV